MSFKFPYKHPLCILIFMYSFYKSLSQGSGNDLKLDLSDFKSIQNFINDNKLAEGANTNTNKLCIPSNLVVQMNKRTNVISAENNETKQYCIEYDNGDNSYINNPERRYNEGNLESKKKEWIEQMTKEYIQSNDNKCAIYSGKKCIYINGTGKNQLKLPLRSLQGYCRGGKPIRWYENTTITCSLKYKATDIKGEIKIKSDGTIDENVTLTNNTDNTSITLDDNSTFTNGTITIKEGTITKSSASTGGENTSRNSEDKITSGTIAIENGSITNGTINTTNDNITITNGTVENSTINSINIIKGTIKDYSIFDNGKYMDNLIQCCNERKGDLLAIGNFTTSCKNNNAVDTIRVDVWVNDKGEILNNSTIYCNKIEKETKLTINVTFSGDKKK